MQFYEHIHEVVNWRRFDRSKQYESFVLVVRKSQVKADTVKVVFGDGRSFDAQRDWAHLVCHLIIFGLVAIIWVNNSEFELICSKNIISILWKKKKAPLRGCYRHCAFRRGIYV